MREASVQEIYPLDSASLIVKTSSRPAKTAESHESRWGSEEKQTPNEQISFNTPLGSLWTHHYKSADNGSCSLSVAGTTDRTSWRAAHRYPISKIQFTISSYVDRCVFVSLMAFRCVSIGGFRSTSTSRFGTGALNRGAFRCLVFGSACRLV